MITGTGTDGKVRASKFGTYLGALNRYRYVSSVPDWSRIRWVPGSVSRRRKISPNKEKIEASRALKYLKIIISRDAPDTVFAGYPAGRISG
jgi:hypothetical protein